MGRSPAEPDTGLQRAEAQVATATSFLGQILEMIQAFPLEKAAGVGGYTLPTGASQQLVDGLVQRLSHQVPQGNLDGARGVSLASIVAQRIVNQLVIEGVRTNHVMIDRFFRWHAAFPPPDEFVVGADLDEGRGACSHPEARIPIWSLEGKGKLVRDNFCDLHQEPVLLVNFVCEAGN